MNPQIAITGVGILTPAGRGLEDLWHVVDQQRTTISEDPNGVGPRWMRCVGRVEAAELPPELPQKLLSQARFLNRGGTLGVVAAYDALVQAGFPDLPIPTQRRSLFLATGDLTRTGCLELYPATRAGSDEAAFNRAAVAGVDPSFLLGTLYNNPFSFLTAALGCMGPGTALACDSPGGAQALDLAVRTCAEGRADLALAVGCGSWLNELTLRELADIGLLSSARNGVTSYRPFDARRDGFLAGEGGAAIVVEPLDAARRRGAQVLGTVLASAGCTQARTGLRVPTAVTERSMRHATCESGLKLQELAFVLPHGSGTRAGDRSEATSLDRLMRQCRHPVPVSALKPYTGHMGAASDLAEIMVGIEAIRQRTVPGTPNLGSLLEGFPGLWVPARPSPIDTEQNAFLSVAYGLGGQSWSVVVAGADGA